METNNGVPAFYAKNRQQWRKWLEKNSGKKDEICLIQYHKKSATPSVSYAEAVEEALCFGWIDSVKHKRDAESTYQRFSPRKPNSNWSATNRERVSRLIEQGLMTEQGQKVIDISKEKGKWEPAEKK
jgi:uncharacterized protein YdeI (YjbR/CyaY-like superfamily)